MENGNIIERAVNARTQTVPSARLHAKINIVEKVGGAPIGLLDHKRHNITSTVLSIKDTHYGKVHENRESASEAEIPSKLNWLPSRSQLSSGKGYITTFPIHINKYMYRTSKSCVRDGAKFNWRLLGEPIQHRPTELW